MAKGVVNELVYEGLTPVQEAKLDNRCRSCNQQSLGNWSEQQAKS